MPGLLACAALMSAGLAFAQDIPTSAFDTTKELGVTLSLPTDVGVGKEGKIYVVDGGNHQVAVFDSLGVRIATLGDLGSEQGQFLSPVGLGIGPKGEIYVADKGNHRLQMFLADGRAHLECGWNG